MATHDASAGQLARDAQPADDAPEEPVELAEDGLGDPADDESATNPRDTEKKSRRRLSKTGTAIALMAAVVVALGALSGWLGYQAYTAHQLEKREKLVVDAARQAAMNLTTIKFDEADRDIGRILETATGKFHDEFQERSARFIEVVKNAQSTSEGTVTEAGLLTQTADRADVLVAVSVKTSLPGVPEGAPRSWRLRITVETTEQTPKIADVQFVI